MFIHNAAQQVLKTGKFIGRPRKIPSAKIEIVDKGCCFLHVNGKKIPNWQPTGEDLTANDWEVME